MLIYISTVIYILMNIHLYCIIIRGIDMLIDATAGTYQKRDLVIPNIIIIKFQNEKTTFNNNILMDLEI